MGFWGEGGYTAVLTLDCGRGGGQIAMLTESMMAITRQLSERQEMLDALQSGAAAKSAAPKGRWR